MNRIAIAITGLHASDKPSPATAIARCLRDWNPAKLQITGLMDEISEPQLYQQG